jgi:hypothetical protein
VNAPVKIPPETEQVGDATTLPDIEQVVSLGEKPEPVTSTVEPTEPEDGLREIDGVLGVVVVVWLVLVRLAEVVVEDAVV